MKILRDVVVEFLGLFVDDQALALLLIFFIASVGVAIKVLGLSPMAAAVALPVGYIGILVESVRRFARKHNSLERLPMREPDNQMATRRCERENLLHPE